VDEAKTTYEQIRSVYEEQKKTNFKDKTPEDFFDNIQYSQESFDSIRAMEDNLVDRFMFLFKKETRNKENKHQGGVSATKVFLEGILSEEGRDYLRILEEHVSSSFMIVYILIRVYGRFEQQMKEYLEYLRFQNDDMHDHGECDHDHDHDEDED